MYKNSKSRQEKEEKINKLILEAEDSIEKYCNSEEELKEYLNFTAKLHNYSYHNTALIERQFPGAYAVGSFKFWNDKGYSIKKGESGISILVPARGKLKFINADGDCKAIEQATPEEQQMIKNGEYKTTGGKLFYRIGYVFDITQTTATKEDLPKIFDSFWLEGDVKNYAVYSDAIMSFAAKKEITIRTSNDEMGNVRGEALPDTKEIFLNKRNSELQNIKTKIHEIAHIMLHSGKNKELSRSEKEFQAELTAYTVCAYFGIDTSDYSFPYISNWTKEKTLNDKKALLKGVTTSANEIITNIESYLVEHKEEALKDPTEVKNYFLNSKEIEETNKRKNEPVVTLTVAECSEYHNIGEFHEGITTVDHAISLFNSIPPERMNGIRGIGINIHTPGTETYEDTEIDILSGKTFDLEILEYVSEIRNNKDAINYITELIEKMPEMEIIGSLPGKEERNEKEIPEGLQRSVVVMEFAKKTEEMFHAIGDNTPKEIEDAVKERINEIKEINNLDFEIKDVIISGSRCRGLENENSDLDVVVEYTGDISEDVLFNYLHETNFEIDGVVVDINPITASKTGTLETYLPNVEQYLEEKKNAMEMPAEEKKEETKEDITEVADEQPQAEDQLSFLSDLDIPEEEPQTAQHSTKIEDFGKKIGGARKDLWKERGLIISDLDEMNAAEKEKYVKKDNVWKKPDYSKMIEEGTPIHVAFFIKKVRDSISSMPIYKVSDNTEENRIVRQNDYIEMITDIRDALKEVKNDNDICNFYDEFLNTEKYVCKKDYSYYLQQTEKGIQVTNKMLKAMHENPYSISRYDREIEKKQFGKTAEEKLPVGFEIHKYNEGDDRNPEWKPGTYFITKKYQIYEFNIETYDEAFKKVKDIASKSVVGRKKKYKPEQLKDIKRNGPDNGMIEGKTTGEMYMDKFGFAGGEFGNWMTEKDRQVSLDLGYDALCDLARALNIEDKDISMNNRLSIAFGSRGHGSAVAHYEPLREVINLTKMHGAGSLAHEWGHAFDDIIGKENGLNGMMTESSKEVLNSMKILMNTMKYRDSTPEETKSRYEDNLKKNTEKFDSWLNTVIPIDKLTEAQKIEFNNIREELLKEAKDNTVNYCYAVTGKDDSALDKLNQFSKSVTNRLIKKDLRMNVYYALSSLAYTYAAKEKPFQIKTEFYKNSIKMDSLCSKEDKGYWQSSAEMFARAFACYIYDKLKEQGIRNDYLCGHANSAIMVDYTKSDMPIVKAYPEGEEREQINKCMDKVFSECIEKNIFKEPINYIKYKSR